MAKAVGFEYYSVYRFYITTEDSKKEIGVYEALSMPDRKFVIYAGKRKDTEISLYERLNRVRHLKVNLLGRDRKVEAELHVQYGSIEELPLLVNAAANVPITKAGKEGQALSEVMSVALEGVCLYNCKYEFTRAPS